MALSPERAEELFSAFGAVRLRRMFGGTGVYAEGSDAMFALEAGGVVYLKSDQSTARDFEREGCRPFAYDTKTGRKVITSFHEAPERLLEDPDAMAEWARRAFAIAQAKARSRTR